MLQKIETRLSFLNAKKLKNVSKVQSFKKLKQYQVLILN